jgi:hypothetical protein
MEMIAHNPANGIYAASPDYIHALEIRQPSRLLFVSGTMEWRRPIWKGNWSSSGPICAPSSLPLI